MHSIFSSAALVALLSAADLAVAAPAKRMGTPLSPSVTAVIPAGNNPAQAFPKGTVFPLPNQFPGNQSLKDIEQQALGTLPQGGPPPPTPKDDDITSLELIALNEIFEVAFFTELIFNITNDVFNYTFHDPNAKTIVLESLAVVQAQEEVHAFNANNALQKFIGKTIVPCLYDFPVSSFDEAIALASTFTDVVLGTLQEVAEFFGKNTGDFPFIRGVASVIAQEGEQNGYYRLLQKKIPSALPFLTTSTREFAFTAIQSFVLPGSCPNVTNNDIHLNTFQPLQVTTPGPIHPVDQTLSFSFQPNTTTQGTYKSDYSPLHVAYINQQNQPVVEDLMHININADLTVTFEAEFPGATNEMNGLTIAAVVTSPGPFLTADDVAAATLFGPGLIEVN